MLFRSFVLYNVFGGVLWVLSMVLTGYFLGSLIPNIDQHIHWVIGIVVFLSILPGIIEVLRARRARAKEKANRLPAVPSEQD